MKTFQQLQETAEGNRGRFCRDAVDDFMGSVEYAEAKAGEAYYNKHNLTIEKFQKFLYTVSGNQVPDIFGANYKLKTQFFRRLVIQQVQYLLGNGATLKNPNNKKKLGKNYDKQLQKAAKKAMASGVAFGFWNYDHLEVFSYVDTKNDTGFCPLYNEETGELDAGIRFWFRTVGDVELFRATLYEADGYTEYKQKDNGNVEIMQPKRAYVINRVSSAVEGVISESGENYGRLPIVPLYANDTLESELVGIRESIDCYDFIKSGLANQIDDAAGFYWLLKNTGGMDDKDLAMFVQRMATVRAAVLDGDEGVDAEAHTLEVPTEARRLMLELLRSDIYEDFQALDVKSLSAAQKTTQEIQAAYQAMDNKCDDFEYNIIEFCERIFALAGFEDEVSFVRNKVVNMAETTNMILSAANYLTREIIVKKLPFLTPEEADAVLKALKEQDIDHFSDNEDDETDENDNEGDNEDDEE